MTASQKAHLTIAIGAVLLIATAVLSDVADGTRYDSLADEALQPTTDSLIDLTCLQVWGSTPITIVDGEDRNCALRIRRRMLASCPASPTPETCQPCQADPGLCERSPGAGDPHGEE